MSIGATQPFRPAGTATLAAGTASASVPLAGAGGTVLVTNATDAVAFVRLGTSAVTATLSDTPVLPNSRIVLAANSSIQHAAAVLAAGSGQLFFSVGDGTP
jgi:hypothetical protein